MFCTYCGKSLEPDSQFCTGCGRPVSESSAAVPVSPPVAVPVTLPATAPSYAPPAVPVQVVSSAQPVKHHRPAGVIFISILSIISGLITIAGSVMFMMASYSIGFISLVPLVHLAGVFVPAVGQTRDAWIHDATMTALVLLLLGIGYLFVAVNLLQLKEVNGRILGMVFSGIVALHSAYLISSGEGSVLWHIIAIGFNAWIIYYLAKPSIKRAFAPSHLAAAPRVI